MNTRRLVWLACGLTVLSVSVGSLGAGGMQQGSPGSATAGPQNRTRPTTDTPGSATAGPQNRTRPTTDTAGPQNRTRPTTDTAGPQNRTRPTTDTAGPQNRTRPTTDLLLSPHRASLDQYCVGCHNQNVRTAGLALDGIDVERAGDNAEVWEKVVRKLRARMMPPPGRPRPDDATFDRLVAHLETSLDRSAAGIPNPGRTDTFRRLNRTEYQNAIRDLLALEVDVASILPKDARAMALTT